MGSDKISVRKEKLAKYGKLMLLALVTLTFLAIATSAQRLPNVNGDSNVWGTVLNDYLIREHTINGTHNITNLNVTRLNATNINATSINATTFYGDGSQLIGVITPWTTGDGVLYNNTANTKVGIGLIDPDHELEVIGSINASINVNASTFNGALASTYLTDGGTIGFDWVDAEVANALTVSGGVLSSNSVDGTWTTTAALTIGDGGDAINIDTDDWDISATGIITGAAMTSVQLTDGGTIGFQWVDAEVSNTLTCSDLVAGSEVVADAEVVDTITISGGTLSSNSVDGTWTTTAALTIGDGGDAINIDSDDWDITALGVITGASMTSTQLTDGGEIGFDWIDDEVSDTLTASNLVAGSEVVADAEVVDTLTISGGIIGANSWSGTLTTTGTATLGDGGDRIDVASDTWDVTNGVVAGVVTLDTGQGANELYDMNQNVLTTSDVAFQNTSVFNLTLQTGSAITPAVIWTNGSHFCFGVDACVT